ncbi:nitroreductase family protein [Enterobacter ludwigii]|uniref:nitroreductase family protein n=2 Tax=Enterobacter ludwigii TaxID=299767 RepID=UPI002FF8F787
MTMNIVQPETSSDETLSFKETARARRSIRSFLDKPLPLSIIREVLEDAKNAPSNCNTQPWNTGISTTRSCLSKGKRTNIRRFSH